jgi:hypothetical protein
MMYWIDTANGRIIAGELQAWLHNIEADMRNGTPHESMLLAIDEQR